MEKIRTYDENGEYDKDVSVRALKRGKVEIGIDIGVDGEFAILTAKDVDELISQLKKAKKVSMQS